MKHAMIEPQRDERDNGNIPFLKYRKRSLESVEKEYNDLLARQPPNYDVTQPFNSENNKNYRDWVKQKVELLEYLNVRKATEKYPLQKQEIKNNHEKMQEYIKIYNDILVKLNNLKAGSQRWLELRDKGRRLRVVVQKLAFNLHCEWSMPDLPPIPGIGKDQQAGE